MDLYELVNETRELSVDKLVEDIKGMGFQSKEELKQYLEENDSFSEYVWESADNVVERSILRYSELFDYYVNNADDIDYSYERFVQDFGVAKQSIPDSIRAGVFYYLYNEVYNNKQDVFFELVNEYFNYE